MCLQNENDIGQQPTAMGIRSAQSSHALHSFSGGGGPTLPDSEREWGRPRSWDNSVQPADLARMISQSESSLARQGQSFPREQRHPCLWRPVDDSGRTARYFELQGDSK